MSKNLMEMKYSYVIALLLCTLILGCSGSSDCPGNLDLGPYSLLPASKDVFLYQERGQVVVFRKSDGAEFRYSISRNQVAMFPEFFNSQCKINPEFYPLYEVSREIRWVELFNDGNSKGIRIRIIAKLNRDCPDEEQIADYLSINFFDADFRVSGEEPWKGDLGIVLDPRNYEGELVTDTKFYPEIELNGKIYMDVHAWEFDEPEDQRKFYYQLDMGVIGFTDKNGENMFTLDRIE